MGNRSVIFNIYLQWYVMARALLFFGKVKYHYYFSNFQIFPRSIYYHPAEKKNRNFLSKY